MYYYMDDSYQTRNGLSNAQDDCQSSIRTGDRQKVVQINAIVGRTPEAT